jgi:hypothetical protein
VENNDRSIGIERWIANRPETEPTSPGVSFTGLRMTGSKETRNRPSNWVNIGAFRISTVVIH